MLIDIYNRSLCGEFLAQLTSAMAVQAVAVYGEAEVVPNHVLRERLAIAVLKDPQGWAKRAAMVLSVKVYGEETKTPELSIRATVMATVPAGNGEQYPADETLLSAQVAASWDLLTEMV